MNDLLSRPVAKVGLLTILALLAVLIAKYCCKQNDNFKFIAVKSPVAIAFVDANRLLSGTVPKAKVTITDPGEMVVSPNGERFQTIEVNGGVMSLALLQKAQYSAESPYRFTVKIEMEGYSTNLLNILVTTDEGQYTPVFMAKLDAPPAGMATVSGSIALNNGMTASNTPLKPTLSNTLSTNNIQVEVQKGTQPIYCNRDVQGKNNPQKLNYKISYASPRNLAVGRTFPGGSLVTDAIDRNGNIWASPNNPQYFASQGWINIEMDADGEPVSGFSKPLSVTMPISDSLLNPLANPVRFYLPGDTIPIWSLSDRGVWREEGIAKVEGAKGNLFVNMTVSHLSTWNLDCPANACSTGQDLTVNYTNNTGGPLALYSELIRSSTGVAYGITGLGTNTDHILTYNSGAGSFTIARTPNAEQVQFIAYDNSAAPGVATMTGVLASTPVFTINCTAQPSPAIVIPATAQRRQVKLKFEYMSAATPICANTVWYKICNGDGTGDCAPRNASAANYCDTRNTTKPLMFGGILNQGDGTVSFYKVSPDDFLSVHCIRLWYAEAGVQQPIDFPIDFSVQPPIGSPESIMGKNGSGGNITIQRWYDSGTQTHIVRIMNGISSLNACI